MQENIYDYLPIYKKFRNAQSKAFNRPYRVPKDWEKYWNNLKPTEREAYRKCFRLSRTTWQNIDLDTYFSCGFELWKGFRYTQWFHSQVINLYIQKSKNIKRLEEDIKKSLVESAKFVKLYCKENNLKSLETYARKRDGFELLCIKHYISDKISKWFLFFLIFRKYCIMEKNDWEKIEEISINRTEMKFELREIGEFLNGLTKCF